MVRSSGAKEECHLQYQEPCSLGAGPEAGRMLPHHALGFCSGLSGGCGAKGPMQNSHGLSRQPATVSFFLETL